MDNSTYYCEISSSKNNSIFWMLILGSFLFELRSFISPVTFLNECHLLAHTSVILRSEKFSIDLLLALSLTTQHREFTNGPSRPLCALAHPNKQSACIIRNWHYFPPPWRYLSNGDE
ncbi:hypothetical protein CEXT_292011 [Caerostris extrusa]|uniref:Uncharacterized protein n=1 Tax=Caerostris extrusa TaxID=172846 RepID=A0AAV4TK46_CAEEX|nr:hypothetical protein CEXT_292011 [Caerostris extrusa]